jgi:hypothetical protein
MVHMTAGTFDQSIATIIFSPMMILLRESLLALPGYFSFIPLFLV